MVLRPVYLALFSLTLLAVIAGSGAVMALAGRGHDVFVFSAGVGVGMSLVLALGLEVWHLSRDRLQVMQSTIVRTMAALQLGGINPRLLLSQYGSTRAYVTPQNATDVQLELECRRLLDRAHQLLEKTVSEHGCCHYCHQWHNHAGDCPVPATQALYERGKARRVPWREYKKTLPQGVI